MINNEKYQDIYICSFASSDLKESILRFRNQANEMGIYKNIKIFNENNLSEKKKNQINELNRIKK